MTEPRGRQWHRLVRYGPITHEMPVRLGSPLTVEERERVQAQVDAVFARRPGADLPKPEYVPPAGRVIWEQDGRPMVWVNKEMSRYQFDRAVNSLRTDLYNVDESHQIYEPAAANAGDYLVICIDRDVNELGLTDLLQQVEKTLHSGAMLTVCPPDFFRFEESPPPE